MTVILPDGTRVAIPQAVEAEGGAAIDAYVAAYVAQQSQPK